MQLAFRIEKRRFVGREFLLFLWFESELFDATLKTDRHGTFGLWLDRSLVLSEGRESTKIVGPMPGSGREAKEALLRGQLPESAGLCVAWQDEETAFVLKAETLSVSGLKLKTVLDKAEAPSDLIKELTGERGPSRGPRAEAKDDRESFFERMTMVQEFEELLETLYRDFLELRLSPRWSEVVVPALKRWVAGEPVDADAYLAARNVPPPTQSEVVPQAADDNVPETGMATPELHADL